jgi:hypothetical protein
MASRETASILLPRDDHRDLTERDITAEGLDMQIEMIAGSLTVPRHLPRCLTNHALKHKESIAEPHTVLNAKQPYPRSTEDAYRDGHRDLT